MKRSLFGKTIKQTFLAVPAAALMLGASQAQTTIGINFQAWYYDSGTIPQTAGFGYGYQTTGYPVTAKAFGIETANWLNLDPLSGGYNGIGVPISTVVTIGSLTLNVKAPNAWMSGIGELNGGFADGVPGVVAPGNNEVTWGYLDDGNNTNAAPSVSVSGLAAKFPNGYVIQTIAANAGTKNFATVDISDSTITNTVKYSTYYVANDPNVNPDAEGGTVGLSAGSIAFTNDTININCEIRASTNRSVLAGFIITDQPVVTLPSTANTNYAGSTLGLSAGAIGIPPLSYQWLHNGSVIPGATTANYTNPSVLLTDAGNYSVVVTNLYGSTSNTVATVTVMPLFVQIVPGNIVKDSKPIGVAINGYNQGTSWLPSSIDFNNLTRIGVEQFIATNKTQIAVAADPSLNSTNGTICFWINYLFPFAFPGTGNEAAMLFDRRTTDGTVIALNASGGIQFQAVGGARFIDSTYVVDGNWHHVAITYGQTTNDTVSIYIDGNLSGTPTANPGNWAWPTNQEIELGHSHDAYWYSYDGQMDDVRIYNRVLTQPEIAAIVSSDALVDTSALKLRFNFDTDSTSYGNSLVWPHGVLMSSPTLGADAVWTPLTNAVSPMPMTFVTPATFYRVLGTP